MKKFDPKLVLEFYANAWPTQKGAIDKRSFVRGTWVPYDRDAINQFLGDPLELAEGATCEYGERRNQCTGFDDQQVGQLLCSPGHDFVYNHNGRRLRIMRTSMTTLTQIWMTFLLSNILPSDHNSDLTIPKCRLVYSLLSQISVDVAGLISDAIRQFVTAEPTRFPADPTKANRALGFPALITGLCQFFQVSPTPSKIIRPPINRAFIDKFCTIGQPLPPVPAPAPPFPHPQCPSLDSLAAHMQRVEMHM